MGPKREELLLSKGIHTIEDLLGHRGNITGISSKALDSLLAQARTAETGCTPSDLVLARKKKENPYLSRYGEDWEEVVSKVSSMSSYTCVTDLVEHIVKESAKMMENTRFEHNWYFYHDALSLMKAKECTDWMKESDTFKRWILPLNELNKGMPYAGHPVGNSPELMPLDCSLFADLKHDVFHHCIVTNHLPENDPHKFSLLTVKRGVSTFLRLLAPTLERNTGSPSSGRIEQDIDRWIVNLE